MNINSRICVHIQKYKINIKVITVSFFLHNDTKIWINFLPSAIRVRLLHDEFFLDGFGRVAHSY